ncbi:MAG: hypothetical protein GEU75_17470 [Dehalococcoidia bacterium]|nr:hypothetical protein [Dehalococcoidia bacterium]
MLEISNAAMSLLKSALDSKAVPDVIFRLVPAEDSFALKVAPAEEEDVIYEQEGVAVLATPSDVAERLDSQVIDVEETDKGPRLIVLPQASAI